MSGLDNLLTRNRAWATRITQADPEFFYRLAHQQSPHHLWIGCSDSRVPSTQLVDLAPGEMFVHRNVANLVAHDDINCMAVVEYAIDVLGVEHVIVCGHYRCGGVKAALVGDAAGLVDRWLAPLRQIARDQSAALEALPDEDARWARLCELNVMEQVKTLASSDIVRRAWTRREPLAVHGWIYDLADGLLRDLNVTVDVVRR